MPSQIFLYKSNPIISNWIRDNIIKKLKLRKDEIELFNKSYKKICLCPCATKKENSISQEFFRKLYNSVEDTDKVKIANRNYLFLRAIFLEFLVLTLLFLFYWKMQNIWIITLIIDLIILWRLRGVAKWLIINTVLSNIKE